LLPVDIHLSIPINFHGRNSIFHARRSTLFDLTTQHFQRQILKTGALVGRRYWPIGDTFYIFVCRGLSG
jgi:hypothetical protein